MVVERKLLSHEPDQDQLEIRKNANREKAEKRRQNEEIVKESEIIMIDSTLITGLIFVMCFNKLALSYVIFTALGMSIRLRLKYTTVNGIRVVSMGQLSICYHAGDLEEFKTGELSRFIDGKKYDFYLELQGKKERDFNVSIAQIDERMDLEDFNSLETTSDFTYSWNTNRRLVANYLDLYR